MCQAPRGLSSLGGTSGPPGALAASRPGVSQLLRPVHQPSFSLLEPVSLTVSPDTGNVMLIQVGQAGEVCVHSNVCSSYDVAGSRRRLLGSWMSGTSWVWFPRKADSRRGLVPVVCKHLPVSVAVGGRGALACGQMGKSHFQKKEQFFTS